MAGKRKHRSKRNKKKQPRLAAPSPAQVVGSIIESIAPPLFASAPDESPAPPEESPASTSGIHAIPPRGEEHRAHARVAIAVAIDLATESHFFSGLSGDVSEGGVFVQTYQDLPVGSDVEVHFELPDGELTAHGQVRWHRENSDSSPPGVGIAFEDLGEDDRQIIQRFCERRAPLYYDVEHA